MRMLGMTREEEKKNRLHALKFIPKRILQLLFEIDELKINYNAHKARYEEIIHEEQQEMIKTVKDQEIKPIAEELSHLALSLNKKEK